MSFKSKQRAKHGHLFGDDPLNATLVSASDDPLFSPSKISQSSRTSTPDPLSRISSPSSSPLDVSSSTPIRRAAKPATTTNTTTANNNSIFGDIDVSKLASNGVYNTTGNRNNNTLRTTTLRSNRQFEQDEEDLFGGGSRIRSRVQSKATHIISKIIEPRTEPRTEPTTTRPVTEPTTTRPVTEQAEPVIPNPAPPVVISTPSSPPILNPTAANQITGEEKPSSSSFFASASRFFKSSSHGNSPKNSSAASSVSNVSIKSDTTVTPPSARQPTPPARQPPPQQQKQPRKMATPPPPPRTMPITKYEEEEEEEDLSSHHVIEDEATRAFADDVISFQANYTPDYTSLSNELSGMDSLRIDNKRLLPSASTPTTVRADVDDPWFDNSRLALTGTIEPSVSSPLHKVSVHDIEPQKRSAFADLINSWNTGQNKFESVQEEDHEQFFSHVAAEQGDVGFGGISNDDDDEEGTIKTSVSVVWDNDEENPWN
ncbi:hypothetical protein BDF21DRAFT_496671 [Thamnidium elegans]|nr:hypothetical protein BDF21DRAFT_496671 [Thamnidium elegans]